MNYVVEIVLRSKEGDLASRTYLFDTERFANNAFEDAADAAMCWINDEKVAARKS